MTTPALSWTRRRVLRTLFCSSALLAINLRPRICPAAEAEDLHWLAIGDYGKADKAQEAVAKGMENYLTRLKLKPEALLLLGDNFYGAMPGGLKSPRWQAGFEEMYPKTVFNCPCPAVLGNHDYHDNAGNEQVQLAYAQTPGTRWTLPAKWYRLEYPAVKPLVTFLFLDTNFSGVSGGTDLKTKEPRNHLSEREQAEQMAWLKAQLAGHRAPFTVVVGHHPVYSNCKHGDTPELIRHLAPLLQEHSVHAYLCGHDHDMQHLELEGLKTSFVISGSGGAGLNPLTNQKRPIRFGRDVHGFAHLQASAERLIFRHVDANGKEVHAFEKRPDGSFTILG